MSTSSSSFQWSVALLLVTATVSSLAACTEQKTAVSGQSVPTTVAAAPSTSPQGGLSLFPPDPNRKTLLSVTAESLASRDARVTWYVDGAPMASSDPIRLDCAGFPRGSKVWATALVDGKEVRSPEVTIGNTPPDLTDVALVPVSGGQGDTLAVTATASDLDGDPVTIQYGWTVNGVPAGNGAKLGRSLRRGDAVSVEVTAHDGRSYCPRIVLNQVMANQPPVFVEHQDYSFTGSTYVYSAQAIDPDGDRVTYSLGEPVEGMTIEPSMGRVTWVVPGGFKGDQSATIVADDGHGGTSRYVVTFTIRE